EKQAARLPVLGEGIFSGPEMVRSPEDGSGVGCEAACDDEKPAPRLWVDASELGVYQLTNESYARFLAATQHPKPIYWDDPNFNHHRQPVVGPSWFDAVAYCDWLSKVMGRRYRLPTEAEWERAARGGVEVKLDPWGDAPPESLPDYVTGWKSGPEPVGLYPPNVFGLYNMCDNVHEWCADWYDSRFYARSPERNPQGPARGSRRASRGGSWRHHIRVS